MFFFITERLSSPLFCMCSSLNSSMEEKDKKKRMIPSKGLGSEATGYFFE